LITARTLFHAICAVVIIARKEFPTSLEVGLEERIEMAIPSPDNISQLCIAIAGVGMAILFLWGKKQ